MVTSFSSLPVYGYMPSRCFMFIDGFSWSLKSFSYLQINHLPHWTHRLQALAVGVSLILSATCISYDWQCWEGNREGVLMNLPQRALSDWKNNILTQSTWRGTQQAFAQARSMVEVHTSKGLHIGDSGSFYFTYALGSLKWKEGREWWVGWWD